MKTLGMIGGSGLYGLDMGLQTEKIETQTPFGEPSTPLNKLDIEDKRLFFIARHGENHQIPPHKINYCANIMALKQANVEAIVAVNAVGSIRPDLASGALVVPDQILDYTYGRQHTLFDADFSSDKHVDFTWPFDPDLRQLLLKAGHASGLAVHDGSTLAVTQGPRLESAAEVDKFEHDGADLVGMTTMPEAVLAREAGIPYAAFCLVVNPAAGRAESEITMAQIAQALGDGMGQVQQCLHTLLKMA